MLCLSRKRLEKVLVIAPTGEQVILTVLEQHGSGQVRLGIEAPRSWLIVREELHKPALRPVVREPDPIEEMYTDLGTGD